MKNHKNERVCFLDGSVEELYKRATKKEAFNSIKELFDKVQEKFN